MKFLSKAYFGLVMAFFYLPIAVLIAFSFNSSKSRTVWTVSYTHLDVYKRQHRNDTRGQAR